MGSKESSRDRLLRQIDEALKKIDQKRHRDAGSRSRPDREVSKQKPPR
jgi:uncharacterized protein YpiB (UPF0302 family)